MITPGSTGLSRDHAHRAPATRVTASRSQLIRALKTRTGAAANPIASHGRLRCTPTRNRSEEHTSELQSLMRISYAVFCLKKKKKKKQNYTVRNHNKTSKDPQTDNRISKIETLKTIQRIYANQ